jgi:hypothetical protein
MYFQDISSYTWFLYLGILLFISHILLYGFGLDLSYFGLLLIYIGLARPVISDWIRYILWFFIFIDIYANLRVIRERLTGVKKTVKIVKKSKNSKEDV